jgi:hypothetical protein
MFFALDESKEHKEKILGGIVIPVEEIPSFERDFVLLRLKHKLFGEIKWQNIDKKYYLQYAEFVDLFLNNHKATFHSVCYRDEKTKYRAGYVLIRSTGWKLKNAGIDNSLFILFDNEGNIGKTETGRIKEFAPLDKQFKNKIEFCNQGASHVLGLLQISDIITGALCSVLNKVKLPKEKQYIVDCLTLKNNGFPLNFRNTRFPSLNDYKIHFFDPDDKPR